MRKKHYSFLSALTLAGLVAWTLLSMMPISADKGQRSLQEFSSERALTHVASLSAAPHYVGSQAHGQVLSYLKNQLSELGLTVEIQQGYSSWQGIITYSQNMVTRIKGSGRGKALLLLSHYDSAPHSKSLGAADDASGIATILEGLRAYVHNKTPHKNDIIVLFSDAEELGLNGAALFVQKHRWAKDVGLVVNFEARGSGGPSCMLMETTGGNQKMIDGFAQANPKFPVSNSLMYSVYKMMPNDTDLTVFREKGNIQGFNFAFIDDHFDYHTVQDDLGHLDKKTLAHQGSYLMPMLQYFADANLTKLTSREDEVYFNTPLGFVHYPFDWNFPLLIASALLFFVLIFIGIGKRLLNPKEMLKGFLPLLGSVLTSGVMAFGLWKLTLIVYPQYSEILQGFTYNGYLYIAAIAALSLGITFFFYRKDSSRSHIMNHFVAALFLWILLDTILCFALPGASFFIWSVFGGLIMFGFYILTQKSNRLVNLLASLPVVFTVVPFIKMFPAGLGLKMLAGSAILMVLVGAAILPVLASFHKKAGWSAFWFTVAAGFFLWAHLESDFEKGKALPDSLVYLFDADSGEAVWASYDNAPDDWTRPYLGDKPRKAQRLNSSRLPSKYHSRFTLLQKTETRPLNEPQITFLKDTLMGSTRCLDIMISPRRNVNRYDIYSNPKTKILGLIANGENIVSKKPDADSGSTRLLSYYVTNNRPLRMQLSVDAKAEPGLSLMESSFDLLENPLFHVRKRPSDKMPKPFVLNDAIIIKSKIVPSKSMLSEPSTPKVKDTIGQNQF